MSKHTSALPLLVRVSFSSVYILLLKSSKPNLITDLLNFKSAETTLAVIIK
jgi:hypothetical protein